MTAILTPQEKVHYDVMTFKTADVIVDDELQVRENIEKDLPEIAASIKDHGLQERSKARLDEQGRPHIFWGFRRFLAIRDVLKWEDVTLDVAKVDEKQAVLLMSIENLDRKNYTPIEEARAYKAALGKGWTAAELSTTRRHKPKFIEDRVKLLSLPDKVKELIHTEKLGVETAIELLPMPTAELQEETARHIIGNHYGLKDAKREIADAIDTYNTYQRFQKDIKASEYDKRPTCKRVPYRPVEDHRIHNDTEAKAGPWVSCQDYDYQGNHIWSLRTGQTLENYRKSKTEKVEREKSGGKAKKGPAPIIHVFRYPIPPAVIGKALLEYGREQAKQQLKGKLKERLSLGTDGVHIEIDVEGKFLMLRQWTFAGMYDTKNTLTIQIEEKDYGDKAGSKAKISGEFQHGQAAVDKENAKIRKFLDSLPEIREYRKTMKTQTILPVKPQKPKKKKARKK